MPPICGLLHRVELHGCAAEDLRDRGYPAWTPAPLSKARIRKAVKRNLTDPSIAAAALNIGPAELMQDMPVFGSSFESLCIRGLRVCPQV